MRLRHAILTLSLLVMGATTLPAQARMAVAPSGRATTEVVLTFVDSVARAAAQPAKIRIDYGQPHLRGRRLFTDSLLPYDQVWRTGANVVTTLTTDVDLIIGGANVPKGTYTIQTIPGRSGWKLMLQKPNGQLALVAAASYDAANDVARVDLRQTTLATPLESFTIWLIPSTQPGGARGELRLAWGTVSLSTDWSVR